MKTCKTCFNALKDGAPNYWRCTSFDETSLVTGSTNFMYCSVARSTETNCGESGKGWVDCKEREAEINNPGPAFREDD